MSGSNRRRHTRVRPRQLATRVRSGDDLHIGLGIENISMGGVFVRCNTPMKVGRNVVLEIMRAGAAQKLELEGKITASVSMAAAAASHRTAGMGISFDPLPPHVESRLEGLIVSIDPSALKLPAAKRSARAPPLGESTELTPAFVPKSKVLDTTLPPATHRTLIVKKPAIVPVDEEYETLRRELQEKEDEITRLTAENKKLRQRLLNLVNTGNA